MNAVHVVVAMKPIIENNADNALSCGVVGLAIDNSRIGDEAMPVTKSDGTYVSENKAMGGHNTGRIDCGTKEGRWPSNIIHDGSPTVVKQFPDTGPAKASMRGSGGGGDKVNQLNNRDDSVRGHDDDGGSAARYFKEIKS